MNKFNEWSERVSKYPDLKASALTTLCNVQLLADEQKKLMYDADDVT